MKVLFLSELFYPHGGGAELATYLYAKLLSETGLNVVVVTNRFAGESEVSKSKNLTVYRLPLFKGSRSVKYSILRRFDALFSSFLKKLMKWADVVYVPRFWYSAIPLAKLYRKPAVVHLHDYIPVCPLSNFYNVPNEEPCNKKSSFCPCRCIYMWERTLGRGFFETVSSLALNSTLGILLGKFVKLCDAIVCVSKTHKAILTKAEKSLKRKVHVIYNPLPNISFIDIEGDDFGYFGGPNYLKGFQTLCQAVKFVNNNDWNVKVHATKFSNFSSNFSSSLREKGFTLYGKLYENRYKKLYEQIRCVIVPSIFPETFSYTTVEALLRGRLVIASGVGAIPEVVSGCDGVWLFSAKNYKELAEKMLYVKDLSKETVVELSTRNREIVLRKFCNQKTIGDFVQMLSVLSDK